MIVFGIIVVIRNAIKYNSMYLDNFFNVDGTAE